MGSTGSENGVYVMKNVNFDHTANPPREGILKENGHLIIGDKTNPNIEAVAGHIRSATGDTSITVDYDSPDITLKVNKSVVGETITGDAGPALPPTSGNWDIKGSHGLNTSGAASTLTVAINNDITLGDLSVIAAGSNALSATTGDINLDAGNIKLPSNSSVNEGGIYVNSARFVTQPLNQANTGVGWNALNFSGSGLYNTAIGGASMSYINGGARDSAFGYHALGSITTGNDNVGDGYETLGNLTQGSRNTAIGPSAGSAYTTTESDNIVIGYNVTGTLGESNVTRIGAAQNKCYIDGIDGVNVGSVATVVTESSDQLGTANILAGSGITVTPAANSITIAASPGTALVSTLTPDENFDGSAATAISPTSGNINILSYNPASALAASTFVTGTINSDGTSSGDLTLENRSWTTQYIVDPSTTLGERGTYTTIASANAAASSGDIIYFRSGTYTEDVTMKAGVTYCSYDGTGESPVVTVVGKWSASFTGTSTISGIRLKTNLDYALSVTGANATKVIVNKCYIECSDHTGIEYSNTNSDADLIIQFTRMDVTTTGIAHFAASASNSVLRMNWCDLLNSGVSTTANTVSDSYIVMLFCNVKLPLTYSSSSTFAGIQNCNFNIAGNQTGLTTSGTGSITCLFVEFISNTASCISVGSGTIVKCQNCGLFSSNASTVTGAGQFSYGDINFGGTSRLIASTTQKPLPALQNACQITSPGAYPYTTVPQDCVILVDTSISAKTINLNASPQTGQTYYIKDSVGSAGTYNITVTPATGNIDGAGSYTINVNYASIKIVYSGSSWFVI